MRDPQPHALDLDGDPLSLLGLDHVVVDVLVVGHAGDGHVHRDRLRRGEVVVRLDLVDLLECPDAEGPQLADAGRRADAEVVQAQWRVGGDLELRLDAVVVDLRERNGRDAGLVEEDLLGVAQPGAGEGDLDLGAALAADRPDRRQAGAGRGGQRCGQERRSAGRKEGFMDRVIRSGEAWSGCQQGESRS